MSLMHASAVSSRRPSSTSAAMAWVLIASVPGTATLTWYFGWGVLTNVLLAMGLGVALEALVLKLRGRTPSTVLRDNSALVTGLLLGISLPPGSSWWLLAVGMVAAIVVAKQLYGGLGQNPFNPAMVGYALLLISFPVPMSHWMAPHGLFGSEALSLLDVLRQVAGLTGQQSLDAISGATPLDAFKYRPEGTMAHEFWASDPLPEGALEAGRASALAWLAGGALLFYRRLISWHIPLTMLSTIMLIATLLYMIDLSRYGSPLFHLLGGGTIFAAFFIATDPVSAAASRRGKLIYAAGIGVLVMVIRTAGSYPDAISFAVLLMNFAVPFIDYYTRPRVQGHIRERRMARTQRIATTTLEDEREMPR
ncbi:MULTISPECIES: RnfABCDGE type electron transport complex subunit D [Halomonadaceae]|uniref:RnfABCDGE type electron transport complex subunit D n=1 Tax=Halomonadaceae TaxID=28256 RepID=UPI00159ABC2D|nr:MULTISPECIES: RnfABCDGE type electron transport complex subunit D [Halomonas]QJQ94241.1 RnfABCDGE type electron transport complex subunit D [Halomonas sp. PA5]